MKLLAILTGDPDEERWLALAVRHAAACAANDAALERLTRARTAFDKVAKPYPKPYPTFSGMQRTAEEIRQAIRWGENEEVDRADRYCWGGDTLARMRGALPRAEVIEAHNNALPEGREFLEADAAADETVRAEADVEREIVNTPADSLLALAVKMRLVERDMLPELQAGTEDTLNLLSVIDDTFRLAGEPAMRLGITAHDYKEWLVDLGYGWRFDENGIAEEYWMDSRFPPSPAVLRCREGLTQRLNRTLDFSVHHQIIEIAVAEAEKTRAEEAQDG